MLRATRFSQGCRVQESRAFIVIAAVALVAALVSRFRILPFLLPILAAAVFGVTTGTDLSWIARNFHLGFTQTLGAAGLAVVVGVIVAYLAAESGALAAWRARLSEKGRVATVYLSAAFAGLGGNAISALAILAPPLGLIEGAKTRVSLRSSLIVNAMQGAVLPAPLPIAALAILGADWKLVLGLGLPLALIQIGLAFWLTRRVPEQSATNDLQETAPNRRAAIGLALAMIVLIGMLILNAFGQIPSEPLGSANARERILRLGLPVMLLGAGALAVLMFAGAGHARRAVEEGGTIARALVASAGILFAVGAAGGFQMVLHTDGVANLVIEHIGSLPSRLGLAIPFMIALVGRALQGSALTAAITAAGLVIPILAPLGLDDPMGRAVAALAISTGAMATPHINDGFFWLACQQTGLRAHQGLRWLTGVTLLQALFGLAFLVLCQIVVP